MFSKSPNGSNENSTSPVFRRLRASFHVRILPSRRIQKQGYRLFACNVQESCRSVESYNFASFGAAVLAIRIQNMLLNEMTLNIDQIFLWTDSTIVLAYIQNESRRFKTFVANRVAEIRDGFGVKQWRHIDGKINPADYGTRGVPLNSLTANHPWLTGPEFLLKDESLWPNNVKIPGLDDNDPELKRAVTMNVTIDGAPPLIDMTRFSSWKRIKRIMSWIYRFLRRCRTKHRE